VRWTVWAIIKSRQSRPEGGFGRWRLTPPRYWGCRLRAGTGGTPHPSRLRRATCLPAGRSVRGSDTPPACHSTPRTPQEEGLRGASFSTANPQGGRLEGQREMVWPWPFFRAASSRAAAVEMSCKAIPVESKMVISSPPVRPGAAPEMTPPMSQRVPSKMPFL